MQNNKSIRKYTEKEVLERQRILFGERYVGHSISSIRAPEWAQMKISSFMQKKKNMLIFCGNPGIGKTHLCASLTDFAMNNFNTFRYWKQLDLLKKVRSSIDEYKGDYLDALKHLVDDDFVIIDDVGSTGVNDWRSEIMFCAIDERYNSMKPTIITSNFSKRDFETKYHPRIASRLFDKDNIVIEILDGKDMRSE